MSHVYFDVFFRDSLFNSRSIQINGMIRWLLNVNTTHKCLGLKNQRTSLSLLILSLILITGCRERLPRIVDRSFYYWKSSFNPGPLEQKSLKDLQIKRLYIKFFDITWNGDKNEPMPIALIRFPGKQSLAGLAVVPTVFITNDCMQKMNDAQVVNTADKILVLINYIASTNEILNIPEIQIDCDWNETTKDKYFHLLQIAKSLNTKNRLLSATIRLHQYKYYKKLGTPPVDRGLLMCYNMGNLKNPTTKNSILDPGELEKYVSGLPGYPLPLDIALPIFNWKVLFRNNKYAGLVRDLPTSVLVDNPAIRKKGNNYELIQNTSIDGYSFMRADVLRDEQITYDDLTRATDILHEKLKTQHFSVVLYHLDSITLSKFSIHELETIFDHLR